MLAKTSQFPSPVAAAIADTLAELSLDEKEVLLRAMDSDGEQDELIAAAFSDSDDVFAPVKQTKPAKTQPSKTVAPLTPVAIGTLVTVKRKRAPIQGIVVATNASSGCAQAVSVKGTPGDSIVYVFTIDSGVTACQVRADGTGAIHATPTPNSPERTAAFAEAKAAQSAVKQLSARDTPWCTWYTLLEKSGQIDWRALPFNKTSTLMRMLGTPADAVEKIATFYKQTYTEDQRRALVEFVTTQHAQAVAAETAATKAAKVNKTLAVPGAKRAAEVQIVRPDAARPADDMLPTLDGPLTIGAPSDGETLIGATNQPMVMRLAPKDCMVLGITPASVHLVGQFSQVRKLMSALEAEHSSEFSMDLQPEDPTKCALTFRTSVSKEGIAALTTALTKLNARGGKFTYTISEPEGPASTTLLLGTCTPACAINTRVIYPTPAGWASGYIAMYGRQFSPDLIALLEMVTAASDPYAPTAPMAVDDPPRNVAAQMAKLSAEESEDEDDDEEEEEEEEEEDDEERLPIKSGKRRKAAHNSSDA